MKKLLLILFSLALTGSVNAAVIVSLNFTEDNNTQTGGAGSLLATDSAGVLNVANWNNVNAEIDTSDVTYPVALNDSTGASSGISLSGAGGTWYDRNESGDVTGTGANQTMMSYVAGIDGDGSPSSSFTLSGFGTQTYDVYLYLHDRGAEVSSTDYTITANSASISFVPNDEVTGFDGTFTQLTTSTAGNYVLFEGVTGNDLVVTATGDGNDLTFAGVQVEVIPEPSSAAMLILGLSLFAARRRR